MTYLLDTDICIGWLRGRGEARDSLDSLEGNRLTICSIVRAELQVGIWKSRRFEDEDELMKFIAPFQSFAFDDASADHYGRIRAQLEREGQMIGTNDLMIASIALANNLTVVTRNVDEFHRVPGLRIKRW